MAVMPGLLEIAAMVDGDAIEPGAGGGLAAELIEFAQGLEEDIVGGVLGLLGITQEAQGEVKNGAAVEVVEFAEFGR